MDLCPQGDGGKLVDSGYASIVFLQLKNYNVNNNKRRWVRNQAGGELFRVGDRWVVNPSGGLESKGHPIGIPLLMYSLEINMNKTQLGATGLAQCAELNWQVKQPS